MLAGVTNKGHFLHIGSGAAWNIAAVQAFNAHTPRIMIRWLLGQSVDDWRLVKPIPVIIEHDDGEVLVREPYFSMHAAAETEPEAVEAFLHVLVNYLEILTESDETLGPHLRDQLSYLRSRLQHV